MENLLYHYIKQISHHYQITSLSFMFQLSTGLQSHYKVVSIEKEKKVNNEGKKKG